MSTTTLSTTWGSDRISVAADWAEAGDQIMGDLEGGYEVANFQHSPAAALRKALEQCASYEGMSSEEAEEAIDAAMSKAVEESPGP